MSGAPITSVQNPRIKSWARLHDRKYRRETGLMLVEGYHEFALAFEAGLVLDTLLLCPELLKNEEIDLSRRVEAAGAEVLFVSRSVLEKLAYREHPDAWLAVARMPRCTLDSIVVGPAPLIIVAENLEKPGNLGAILRSAEAVGATAVLVCEGRTDVYNPNVVRSSKGSLFALPVVECSNHEALAWLSDHAIEIIAATPEASESYWDIDMRKGIALAVGAEKEGLSDFWMAQRRVLIPMHGRVNSLNVAQAATILAYEALRQRAKELSL